MPSKRATVPVLSLRMRPSKCALCSWFEFKRLKCDVELDQASADHAYREIFYGMHDDVFRKILKDIKGQLVHPRCLKYVREAEEQLWTCTCCHNYNGNPTLEVDYDD